MDLVELLKSVLYGIVEGASEWLPVSSAGHLWLLRSFFVLQVPISFWRVFLAAIQLGATGAVCKLSARRLNPWASGKDASQRGATWSLWRSVAIASLPSLLIGLLPSDRFGDDLGNPLVGAAILFAGGAAFVVIETMRERRAASKGGGERVEEPPAGRHLSPRTLPAAQLAERTARIRRLEGVDLKTTLWVGVLHALSPAPATSRLALAIVGALVAGCSRAVAVDFALCVAIPTMLAVNIPTIVAFCLSGELTIAWAIPLLLGAAAAYGASLVSVSFITDYVRHRDLKPFGWYRIVLGVAIVMRVITL